MSVLDKWSVQNPLGSTAELSSVTLNPSSLVPIIKKYRPDLSRFEDFYKKVHKDPEISCLEEKTAALVASHLRA